MKTTAAANAPTTRTTNWRDGIRRSEDISANPWIAIIRYRAANTFGWDSTHVCFATREEAIAAAVDFTRDTKKCITSVRIELWIEFNRRDRSAASEVKIKRDGKISTAVAQIETLYAKAA